MPVSLRTPILLFLLLAALMPLRSVQAAPAGLDTRGDIHPHVKRDAAGRFVFRNRHLVAVLEKSGAGYGPLRLYPASRPSMPPSKMAAEVVDLARLGWRNGEPEASGAFTPVEARILGDDRVELRGSLGSGADAWAVTAELSIDRHAWLSWEVTARPGGPTTLTQLVPMSLRVPAGADAEVLYPGVLRSRDAPAAVTTPDPFQVTIPYIAVSEGDQTVALMWDRPSGRPAGTGTLRRMMGSDGAGDYRLALEFATDFRIERGVGESSAAALPVQARQDVRLAGKIVVLREENDPAAVTRQWVEAYGQPISDGFPRTLDAERRLLRETYLRDAEPGGSPVRAVALLIEDALAPGGPARLRIRDRLASTLVALRTAGPLDPRIAYRDAKGIGELAASIDGERAKIEALLLQQLPDGGWPRAGSSAESGLPETASGAVRVLRFAALTGDTDAAGAGRRALELLERTYQFSEIVAPFQALPGDTDVVTLAQAAEAFLLGYHANGERRYVENARFWAGAALPYVYFWRDAVRPALQHAVLPRLGVPQADQSAGLELARVLRAMVRVRPDGVFEHVSEGIIASAIRQQAAAGADAGLLPSSWGVRENKAAGALAAPDPLARAIYSRMGLDPEVSHARSRVGPDRLFVASGAAINGADTSAMRLRMRLHWLDGEQTWTTITGVTTRPLSVEYNSNPLRSKGLPVQRTFLPEAGAGEGEAGWTYDPDAQLLTLRLGHTGGDDRLEIRWPDARGRSPVKRVDRPVRFRR